MVSPGISAKKRHAGAGFALGCGCKDAKSVSVSASATGTGTPSTRRRSGARTNPSVSLSTPTTTTDTLTMTSASSSFLWEHSMAAFDHDDDDDGGDCGSESFSGLLRELNELEQSVASWGRKSHHHDKKHSPPPPPPPQDDQHRKEKNSGGDGEVTGEAGDGGGDGVGLDGSVAVVKQSDDPLGDFRRSMLQMIVENGIVDGEDLREMLRRFIALNAPHHHDVILRAFAEIWDGVFAAVFLVPSPAPHTPSRREPAAAASRPPVPRTPPRHRHPTPAWRV
uniref:Transcription repressor n=1 Tax=Leersia perrieri TaxID=77586 RepID=A0A0D9VJI2_9ORYZ